MRAEQALLEWIPVNSRLCAVRLNGSVRTQKDRDTRRCLFVVSAHAPTDCSSDEVKNEFYRKLSELLQKAKRLDIVLVAGDFNAQIGSLNQTERHLGGYFSIPAQRTGNGGGLLQLCSDNRLFLTNTNFKTSSNMASPCTKPTMYSNRPYCHQSSLERVGRRLSFILEYLHGLQPCPNTGTHLLAPHWTQKSLSKKTH
ncbi:unnamed protein product [Schistosoma curassoni]|nr:unnamed protein product [Schistosoma curassoni]